MSITLLGKVLIVEDSPSELELMSHYLRDSNYKVLKTSRAKEALEIILEEKPDIVITDVVMPEMSGFELCRFLRRNVMTYDVRIIICSSKNQPIDRLWGMRQGADIYLTKPYTREQLLDAINSVRKS
jgi:two-component system, chemotaxis family, response regulator PixH